MTSDITTTTLAISLIVLASISTVAAFGGDPWKKGSKPLYARVTWRGWIALACLTLMLPLSVWKEKKAQSEEAEKVAAAERNADRRQQTLQNELNATEAQLTANQNQLTATQAQLDAANNLNLISVFATAPQDVFSLKYYIPLSSSAGGTSSIYEALTPPPPSKCKIQTVHVSLWDGTDAGYSLAFANFPRTGANKERTSVSPEGSQESSILLNAWSSPLDFGVGMFDHQSYGSRTIAFSRHPAARTSASGILAKLLSPRLYAPDYLTGDAPIAVFVDEPGVSNCKKEIEHYFQEAFGAALFGLVLNTSPKSAIYFKLKAVPFDTKHPNSVVMLFRLDGQPVITVDPFLTWPLRNIPTPAMPEALEAIKELEQWHP